MLVPRRPSRLPADIGYRHGVLFCLRSCHISIRLEPCMEVGKHNSPLRTTRLAAFLMRYHLLYEFFNTPCTSPSTFIHPLPSLSLSILLTQAGFVVLRDGRKSEFCTAVSSEFIPRFVPPPLPSSPSLNDKHANENARLRATLNRRTHDLVYDHHLFYLLGCMGLL